MGLGRWVDVEGWLVWLVKGWSGDERVVLLMDEEDRTKKKKKKPFFLSQTWTDGRIGIRH